MAAVGDRERVIASTDCGFGTFTNREWVVEPVVWLKLKALRDGSSQRSSLVLIALPLTDAFGWISHPRARFAPGVYDT